MWYSEESKCPDEQTLLKFQSRSKAELRKLEVITPNPLNNVSSTTQLKIPTEPEQKCSF